MKKFKNLKDILNNIEGLILGKESLIDLSIPFRLEILEKSFVCIFRELELGVLKVSIPQGNEYKWKLEVSLDELASKSEESLKKICDFICNAVRATPEVGDEESLFLKNSMTRFPTTLSKDLVLRSYVPRLDFFEKVREIKLEEKNIELTSEGQILIKNKGQIFVYILDEEKKREDQLKTFIEI